VRRPERRTRSTARTWDDATAPALGDLDGDGDLDLVAGEFYGRFFYFENTGSARARPSRADRSGQPLNGQDVGSTRAALGDLDGDGDLDLVAGEYPSAPFATSEHGQRDEPGLRPADRSGQPLNGQDVGRRSVPALGDLDGDGDLDLVAGEYSGTFFYFENTGTRRARPSRATGAANPSRPGRGTIRARARRPRRRRRPRPRRGQDYGRFFYFENTGSARARPSRADGAANPLDGQVSAVSSPRSATSTATATSTSSRATAAPPSTTSRTPS
jgi:hypothetical protein